MPGATGFPVFTMKVAGSDYDYQAGNIVFRHCYPGGKGDRGELAWTVRGGAIPSSDPFVGKSIELLADEGSGAYRLFFGRCLDLPYTRSLAGWNREYVARGLRDLGDRVAVTNPVDGTDKIGFNLRFDDRDYVDSLAGRTVGEIITYTLQAVPIAKALTAYGVGVYTHVTGPPETYTLPTATSGDLSALTIIPQRPVYIAGERVLQSIEGMLRDWAPNHIMVVLPDGTIRILDVRTFGGGSPTVLRLDNSSGTIIHLDDFALTSSISDCYARVRVRGSPLVVGAWLSTAAGTLLEDFAHDGLDNAKAKAAWRSWDYVMPGQNTGAATFLATISGGAVTGIAVLTPGFGYTASQTGVTLTITGGGGTGATGTFSTDGYGQAVTPVVTAGGSGYTSVPQVTGPARAGSGQTDTGTCTMSDTTHVTVTSADTTKSWPSNFWDWTSTGRHGTAYLSASIVSGVNALDAAKITSNTSLSAGGTSTLTLDRPMPSTSFDSYTIYGTAGGAANVWRRYKAADTGIRAAMATYFPFPVVMTTSDGTAAEMVSRPVMQILYAPSGFPSSSQAAAPLGMTVDVTTGYIYADRPVVTLFGTSQNLQKGGSATDGIPTDVRVFAAVRKGNLEAIKPADSGGSPTYEGTSHTVYGVDETLTITVSDWIDKGQQTQMDAYAQDLLDSVKDVVYEGAIPLVGYYKTWLTDFGAGVQVKGPSGGYTLPWESVTLPVVRAGLEWTSHGPLWRTVLYVSTRRAAYTEDLYRRTPPVTGIWWGADLTDVEFQVGAPWMDEGGVHKLMFSRGAQGQERWTVNTQTD